MRPLITFLRTTPVETIGRRERLLDPRHAGLPRFAIVVVVTTVALTPTPTIRRRRLLHRRDIPSAVRLTIDSPRTLRLCNLLRRALSRPPQLFPNSNDHLSVREHTRGVFAQHIIAHLLKVGVPTLELLDDPLRYPGAQQGIKQHLHQRKTPPIPDPHFVLATERALTIFMLQLNRVVHPLILAPTRALKSRIQICHSKKTI